MSHSALPDKFQRIRAKEIYVFKHPSTVTGFKARSHPNITEADIYTGIFMYMYNKRIVMNRWPMAAVQH